MNISGGSGPRSKGGSQEFDLNLAPIIDCFTVLITFMLVSASFLAIGIFSAGIEAAGQAASEQPVKSVHLELALLNQFEFELKLTGKTKLNQKISAKNGDWDLDGLEGELRQLKGQWGADLGSLTITAQNDIEYLQLIRTMESTRKVFLNVYIGGF